MCFWFSFSLFVVLVVQCDPLTQSSAYHPVALSYCRDGLFSFLFLSVSVSVSLSHTEHLSGSLSTSNDARLENFAIGFTRRRENFSSAPGRALLLDASDWCPRIR